MIIVRPTHKESDMAGGLPETEMTVQEAAVQCTVSTNEVTFFKHLFLFKFGWQSNACVKMDGIFVAKIKHVFFCLKMQNCQYRDWVRKWLLKNYQGSKMHDVLTELK